MVCVAATLGLAGWLASCSDSGSGGGSNGDGSAAGPSSFMLAVIPDTQFLSENNRRGALGLDKRYPDLPYGPELAIYAQTQWLADHAESSRIAFVVQVGDLVQNGGDYPREWKVADRAMQILESSGVSYGFAPGNHDVHDKEQYDNERRHSIEGYLKNFGPQRARDQNGATLIERDPLGYSEARLFEVLQQNFLVLSMDWKASEPTLAWARGVLAAHPQIPTIVTSHDILDVDGNGATVVTENGARLWSGIIDGNDQVFMTLSGHNHHSSRLTRANHAGHAVEMILVDYQDEYAGGNGLMRLMELDFARGSVEAFTFSPWVLEKIVEADKRKWYVPCATPERTIDCDQLMPEPNVGADAHYDNRYVFPLDFKARFTTFGGYTAVVDRPETISLTSKLRAALTEARNAAGL